MMMMKNLKVNKILMKMHFAMIKNYMLKLMMMKMLILIE
jgi:hypothetical protein